MEDENIPCNNGLLCSVFEELLNAMVQNSSNPDETTNNLT